MELERYSTITSEQVRVLAGALARGEMPVIDRFEPVADFEELSTFAAENPTPVFSGYRDPVWRPESVAARLVEAFAIASHEPLSEEGLGGLGEDYRRARGVPVHLSQLGAETQPIGSGRRAGFGGLLLRFDSAGGGVAVRRVRADRGGGGEHRSVLSRRTRRCSV